MSRGLGQLQRRILDVHQKEHAEYLVRAAKWVKVDPNAPALWSAGSASTIGKRIYGEPTESQLRSIRRAAKRLIEGGYLTKDTRAAELAKAEREGKARQYQIIRDALESLNTEHPGKMFDADAVAKRAAETVPGWHKLGGQSPHSATMVASGLLRTLREHGDVYSLRWKQRWGGWAMHYALA